MDILTMTNLIHIRIHMLPNPSKVTPIYINQQLPGVYKDSEAVPP